MNSNLKRLLEIERNIQDNLSRGITKAIEFHRKEKQELLSKLESQLIDAEKVNLKCNHSCDCTDCQWRCVKCETERFIQKKTQDLESEIKQLKEKYNKLSQEHIAIFASNIKNINQLEQYKTVFDDIEELVKKCEDLEFLTQFSKELKKILAKTGEQN